MFAIFSKNVFQNSGHFFHKYPLSRMIRVQRSSFSSKNMFSNKFSDVVREVETKNPSDSHANLKLNVHTKNSNFHNNKKDNFVGNDINANKNREEINKSLPNKKSKSNSKKKNATKKKSKKSAEKLIAEERIDPNPIINFDLNSDCDDIIFDLNLNKSDRDRITGERGTESTSEFSSYASSFSSNQFLPNNFPTLRVHKNENEYEFQESQIAKRNLLAFIHILIFNDNLSAALPVLLEFLSKFSRSWHSIDIENCFELLVKGWARKGSTDNVIELLKFVRNDLKLSLNVNFYEYYLLSLSKQIAPVSDHDVQSIIADMRRNHLQPEYLFHRSTLNQNEIVSVKKFLREHEVYIFYKTFFFPKNIENVHIKALLSQEQQIYEPFQGINYDQSIAEWVEKQFNIEQNFIEKIPPIKANFYDLEKSRPKEFYEERIRVFEAQWKQSLTNGFKNYLEKIASKKINGIPFIHFMTALSEEQYVDIMLEEIRICASFSEHYSPFARALFEALGKRVLQQYILKSDRNDQTLQDFARCYYQYIQYTKNPQLMKRYNPREYWFHLLENGYHYYFDESKMWTNNILTEIGKDLYELISRCAKFNPQMTDIQDDDTKPSIQPVLSFLYKSHDIVKTRLSLHVHPLLIRLYDGSESDLYFEPERLPMRCPPVPWISPSFGGNLLARSFLIRAPQFYPKYRIKKYTPSHMFPTYDSINALSLCPWKINTNILDLAIHVFKNKGNLDLDIPTTLSSFGPLPKITSDMTLQEKEKVLINRRVQRKEQAEMYSLWADCQYKLSISNHFRDKVFWFPINMDFRSRVYPIPPNFNHLGSDLSRALLLFAKGKPLGENGLRWLKIHLINLTGFMKRSETEDRLKYCDENIDLIMDSADDPFGGKKWWMGSDEKWQTLACCIELTRAIRSGDPESYISHIPIHQDGSCNGLQHYAALGRDVLGAKSVNLAPSKIPQDVYSDVAALVEIDIENDFNKGLQIAGVVKGKISRKIVKQTVMTYVYGVTKFGAKQQVLKRLKEKGDFPEEHFSSASTYISQKILDSIKKMFTQTRVIQDWLTNCAQIISKNYGSSVEWITPINFPVIQSYYKKPTKSGNVTLIPNPMKQKNAFPANFIHSLDSTHMMLTALECHRSGLTFASVHDCYWTHACDVNQMNLFCRRQFVALHSEPILDNLSEYLTHFVQDPSRCMNVPNHEELVKYINQSIEKGEFDLRSVLDSEFFFS